MKNALENKNELTLVATATDEDGAGLNTNLNIKIKKLEGKHFTVLTIANEYLDSVDSIVERVVTEAQVELHILRAAVISAENENTQRQRNINAVKAEGEETVLRLIVYAFDANENPIETDDLKE